MVYRSLVVAQIAQAQHVWQLEFSPVAALCAFTRSSHFLIVDWLVYGPEQRIACVNIEFIARRGLSMFGLVAYSRSQMGEYINVVRVIASSCS